VVVSLIYSLVRFLLDAVAISQGDRAELQADGEVELTRMIRTVARLKRTRSVVIRTAGSTSTQRLDLAPASRLRPLSDQPLSPS